MKHIIVYQYAPMNMSNMQLKYFHEEPVLKLNGMKTKTCRMN